MRTMLIRIGAAVAAALLLSLLRLAKGRDLSEVIDAVATKPMASLSPSPFGWNGIWLQFGPPLGIVRESLVGRMSGIDPQFRSLDLTGPGPLYGNGADLVVDADGRLILSYGGRGFVLGVRTGGHIQVEAGDAEIAEFVSEVGDRASLVIERSFLAWPTLFEINFVGLGGTATTWKRHIYYHLLWVKASGARLTMMWAGEQSYDSVNLWRAPGSFLTKVEIREPP
jgi:hypothetical protein